MANTRLYLLAASLVVYFCEIRGHGKMMDPFNRSSLWRSRKYPQAKANYEDNQNFCGGFYAQYNETNGGKCGPCGDNYQDPVPRDNENGGIYGKGIIVKEYKSDENITVVIDLSANHLGHFEFNICDLRNETDVETEECFDKYPLKLVNKDGEIGYKYVPDNKRSEYEVEVFLPKGFKCKHCVLRWHYRAGNNWGWCDDEKTKGELGCGDQEIFRSCADIAIV